MKLSVTLDRDEDGNWIVECPAIPGCVSQGDTKEQALANIREAIALCMEVRAEQGLPLTIETQQIEVPMSQPSRLAAASGASSRRRTFRAFIPWVQRDGWAGDGAGLERAPARYWRVARKRGVGDVIR